MSIKITSPIEGYAETTTVGSLVLEFKDGSASVEKLSKGHRAYLLGAGYTVSGQTISQPDAPTPVDSRDLDTPTQVGESLRDAAVDPEPGDFLAPTNAGKADPHGPDVVAPQVHGAAGIKPLVGGDVHVGNPDAQEAKESAAAEAATQPLEELTIPKLKEVAAARGVDLTGKSKKDEILDAFKAHDEEQAKAAELKEAEAREAEAAEEFVLTYKDADGAEQTLEFARRDIDEVQAQFAEGGEHAGLEVVGVARKDADASPAPSDQA